MNFSKIEVDSTNGTGIGAKFTHIGPDGTRSPMTNVRSATLRIVAGEANSLYLDTVMTPAKATAERGHVVVTCPLCDASHSHRIGELS